MDNKKFYIVGISANFTGLGAILISVISHIIYAQDRGLIPIIDLKHYKNQYHKDGKAYKENAWEYFFEQPSGYKLEDLDSSSDIQISDNIRLCPDTSVIIYGPMLPVAGVDIDERLLNLKTRYSSLIKFNSKAKKFIEDTYEKVIGKDECVLGVLCRGTDYTVRRSFGEPKQPKPKQVIRKVREFLNKHSEITKIYLATEDDCIYKLFKNAFGDMLIDNNQYRYSYSKDKKPFLCDIKVERANHNYLLGFEYLSSLYILSKCKYFVGGRCAGSIVAWIMQDCWQDLYIYKLGYYGKSLKDKLFSKTIQHKNSEDSVLYSILGIKLKIRIK